MAACKLLLHVFMALPHLDVWSHWEFPSAQFQTLQRAALFWVPSWTLTSRHPAMPASPALHPKPSTRHLRSYLLQALCWTLAGTSKHTVQLQPSTLWPRHETALELGPWPWHSTLWGLSTFAMMPSGQQRWPAWRWEILHSVERVS